MRILAVHSYYRLRGGEDVVFDAETALLEDAGHDVIRLTRRNESMSTDGKLANARKTIWNQAIADEVAAIVQQERVEVVHFHNTFPAISPAPIRAAHEAGAVTVQTLHNSRLLCPKAVCFRDSEPCTKCVSKRFATPAISHACFHENRLATSVVAIQSWLHRSRETYSRFLDVAIAPSDFLRTRFQDSGYPMAPIVIKPHFVETDLEAGDGLGGYALFVGRLSEEKGLQILLDAWSKLSQPIELRIIGDGPLSDRLRNPPPGVVFMGRRSQEEVYESMGEAAMLVLPSHCAESFGRVCVESFAKGTPVVCADQGGQAELVNGRVGGTFQSGDSTALAELVDQLLSDEILFTSMRGAARQEYESKYTAATNLGLLEDVYLKAMQQRGIAPQAAQHEFRHDESKDVPVHSSSSTGGIDDTVRASSGRNHELG